MRLELFHKHRSTSINGNTIEQITQDLCESVNWFRMDPDRNVSDEEKQQIISRFTALSGKEELSGSRVCLPLRFFVSESDHKKPLRVGLEAEYARDVRSSESTPNKLKYEQVVGKILTKNAVLINIKLDGVKDNSALLELECRPFSLDSEEFSQQLQIIDIVKKAISGVEQGSSVQEMIRDLKLESDNAEICVEPQNPLVFKTKTLSVGPFVQITLELPLSCFGDPDDTAILDLVENPGERNLLVHARRAATDLVEILKPMASELHGHLYKIDSIKLAKLRGYWAQTIIQACQVIHYDKKKESVRFHIRAAGPISLSARDVNLLNIFFNEENRRYSRAHQAFKTTLEQALEEGLIQIAAGGSLKNRSDDISWMIMSVMTPCSNFAPNSLQFKSDSFFGARNLEFRYGMTLVELRTVHSSLNKGILEHNVKSYERIKDAQALPEFRPKKTFSI